MIDPANLTPYQTIVRELSDRLVSAQQPLRVLDAIKWGNDIQEEFFKHQCKKMPDITAEYYKNNALNFDASSKKAEFYDLERDIKRQLGQFSGVGNIMQRMCREYRELVRMLEARGTYEFSKISQELYGSADDAFYAGAPRLRDLAELISQTLDNLKNSAATEADDKKYSSEEAVTILSERLNQYFGEEKEAPRVSVKLNDGIVADAAAGADIIKIRSGAFFSERDLRVIEVHEGWVHIGTTINGLRQPVCTFLSKGPPSSTITQEGLAIINEVFTFASYPGRLQRITDRITAIALAEDGANFIEVFNFFRDKGREDKECYAITARIFRGSIPTAGPFTKDLVYSKGFVQIYNYLRLAIQRGLVSRIPLLFAGKTTLSDQKILSDLVEEDLVVPPRYVPTHFKDIAALSAWMSYSLFLNRLNLQQIALDYKDIL